MRRICPSKTDIAFEEFFGLVDRLDNVVVDIQRTSAHDEVPQDDCLADRIGNRLLEAMSLAWPAEFANNDLAG